MKKSFIKNSVSFLVLAVLCLPITASARHTHTISPSEERDVLKRAVGPFSNELATRIGLTNELTELEAQRKRASSDIQERIDRANAEDLSTRKELKSQNDILSERHRNLTERLGGPQDEVKFLEREITENTGFIRRIETELDEHNKNHAERLSRLAREMIEALAPYEPRWHELTRLRQDIDHITEEHVIATTIHYDRSLSAPIRSPLFNPRSYSSQR